MKFEIDGMRYRIFFKHDKAKDWAAHRGHELRLYTQKPPKRFGGPGSPHELWCEDCRTKLAGIGPRVVGILKRERRASFQSGRVVIVREKLVSRELARNVRCLIENRLGDEWIPLYTGFSRLNTDAGDRYNREQGRLSALRDALPKEPALVADDPRLKDPEWVKRENFRHVFCATAMSAYLSRDKGASKKAGSS